MSRSQRRKPCRKPDTETTDELIGLLNAISIVSKRLARNLMLLQAVERQKGDADAGFKYAHAN